jgi:GNAT superfamily N-acetyltransferase
MESMLYAYVRSRQLEGTYDGTPHTGVWVSTGFRVRKGWGSVEENEWPWPGEDDEWPPVEPANLDILAKANRLFAYHRASTVDDCRVLLASKVPIVAAFKIDESWFDAPRGVLPPPIGQAVAGSHCICLAGYDDRQRHFAFANSWGTGWGDRGFGYLPYDYFSARFLEGWTYLPAVAPYTVNADGRHLATWAIINTLGSVTHGVEITDGSTDEMIGWGFAIERDEFLDVEELFVRPDWRMQGHASRLASQLAARATDVGKALRVWIPHSDIGGRNSKALTCLLHRLGLSLQASPVTWAAAVGAPPSHS